jgi:adaptin ear-binding coat-associated protein 1/2
MSSEKAETEDSESPLAIEQKLLSIPEVFVYKVPPLRTPSGHRAEDWGLADPLYTGMLRMFQADTKLRIVLYAYRDTTTLKETDDNLIPFGECPIEVKPKEDIIAFVDAVIDSSRYFVIKLKDPNSTRTTSIGIGFRDREVAFDFKNSLNEYVRYIDRMALGEELAKQNMEKEANDGEGEECETGGEKGASSLLAHLSLGEGQKIHVQTKFTKKASSIANNSNKPIGGGFLAPPPAAGSTVFAKIPDTVKATDTNPNPNHNNDDDDDFGDFQS